MLHKMFTLDDLYEFYANQNKSCEFNSSDSDSVIIVQVPEQMEFSDEYDPQFNLLKTHLMSCHLLENLNKSSISEEAMKQAIPSFYNRPILGYIQKIEDENGNVTYDFAGHEMHEDENGEIVYEEIPVGIIPESCNAQLIYHEEYDKTYLELDGYIFEDYTKAADILRKQKKCDVSIEISVDKLSFNAKTKIMNIDEFHFLGVAILGVTRDESHQEINPGMAHSNITLADFSIDNNSFFNDELLTTQNNIILPDNVIDSIADAVVTRLSDKAEFSAKNLEEGGEQKMDKLNELLAKYEKTIDEVTFEYESLTDDELEEAFKNAFESEESNDEGDAPSEDDVASAESNDDSEEEFAENDGSANEPESSQDESDVESEESDGPSITNNSIEYSVNVDGNVKHFSVSLMDKINALSVLVNDTYSEADNTWYCCDVYEEPSKFVVMHDYWYDRHYRQEYSVKKDVYSLKGDRVQVYAQYLTNDEINQLESMKNNYSAIESKLSKYETEPEKMAVLDSDEYVSIRNTEEFVELREEKNHFDLSVDEVKSKLDEMLLSYAKSGKLEFVKNEENKPTTKKLFGNNKVKKSSRYGNLFANKK